MRPEARRVIPPPPSPSWLSQVEHRSQQGPCRPGLWPGRVRGQRDSYVQVQTAVWADEKGPADREEEAGWAMGCPEPGNTPMPGLPVASVMEGQSEGRWAWGGSSLVTLHRRVGLGVQQEKGREK